MWAVGEVAAMATSMAEDKTGLTHGKGLAQYEKHARQGDNKAKSGHSQLCVVVADTRTALERETTK